MRPTLLIGISAILALATTALTAGADGTPPPPPTFSYAGGNVTVSATGSSHINGDYSWSIKDGGNNTLKPKSAFTFSGGSSPNYATATVGLVAGTLKGAYCGNGSCVPFTATCTASACTMN
jgi:hypothetical protein